METISVSSRTLCPTVEVGNGDFFLTGRDGPKELLWKQQQGCHFVSFFMQIYGAKFQEHCFNISRDISFIQYFPLFSCKQYDVITDQIYIIEKR